MAKATSTELQTIPLFPLPNIVLFPGMILRLHIFEPRYREMVKTVLDADSTFGIQLCKTYNPITLQGVPFDVGTTVEFLEVEPLDDGRYHLMVKGAKRFQVDQYNEAAAYLRGTVHWLAETDVRAVSAGSKLVCETQERFLEAIRLAMKILKEEFTPPPFPTDPQRISYLIAENLRGSLVLKQELLEMPSTRQRLKRERDLLTEILKTLSVQAQIEEAFSGSEKE